MIQTEKIVMEHVHTRERKKDREREREREGERRGGWKRERSIESM